MDSERIVAAAKRYEAKLLAKGYNPVRFPAAAVLPSETEALQHALWMCHEILLNIVGNNRPAKAERWLCFVQGVLWMTGTGSIDDFREDNAGS